MFQLLVLYLSYILLHRQIEFKKIVVQINENILVCEVSKLKVSDITFLYKQICALCKIEQTCKLFQPHLHLLFAFS